MLKQHLMKLLVSLAIVLSLLGGIALGVGATAAKVAPAQHSLACGGADAFPPCE